MAKDHSGPHVPTERPDRDAAARDPKPGAENRPGFDLGGAVEETSSTVGSATRPNGPKGSVAKGTTGDGRASGLTDLSGSRPGGKGTGGGS